MRIEIVRTILTLLLVSPLVAGDVLMIPLGQVDGDGHFPVSVGAPQLAPGEEGSYLQLVMQDAKAGTTRLGSPITVVVVEPGS